jgi:hypothetical protein
VPKSSHSLIEAALVLSAGKHSENQPISVGDRHLQSLRVMRGGRNSKWLLI